MAIVACSSCSVYIDLDYFPEVYYVTLEDGTELTLDEPLCENCKEEKYA